MPNELRLKTSRKKFIFIYIFAILLIILYPMSDFASQDGIYDYLFFFFVLVALLYPEIKIVYSSYIITSDNVIEVKGIITKERTVIPFSSISHVIMKKGLIGTILNFGDIIVTSFNDLVIVLEGINNPERVSEEIEKNVEKTKRI
ncbi:MAG: PH domain-containing protein [Candidatus Aenigmarchaeota archaeon]|nr:PH domain-containing protein [Candidatus Aenigmarchaeota archaeon]MBU5688688.1 PH domain-containing protein [Candidatus Aenigmarchaeota archaeon]